MPASTPQTVVVLLCSVPLLFFPFRTHSSSLSLSHLHHSPRVAMSNPFSDPPPLPPKQYPPSRRQYQQHQSSKSNPPSQAHYTPRTTDPPPRTRPSRSQTTGPPFVVFIFSPYRLLITLHRQKTTARPSTLPLVLNLRLPDDPILRILFHQIKRNSAQKLRRPPFMPMSLID